jgi:mono/diheme cytochrome c family protein
MTTPKVHWGRLLSTAVLVGATAVAGIARADQQPIPPTMTPVEDGAHLFRTYCASCHGTSGRGDGPLADSMRRRPANLTEIQKRNMGAFPKDLVFQIIDGRQKVRGHGGPDMPVWGDAFKRSINAGDENAVARRIRALVDYLETIQARDTQ